MAERRHGLPAELARFPLSTMRPQDAASVYAHPRPQVARLVRNGDLYQPARGFYVVVPRDRVDTAWHPELEAVAAGIATAQFGEGVPVLMGVSAARLHGAIPRALATAVVAVPRQHKSIRLMDRRAVIRFVARDTEKLDAELMRTELGPVLATTAEQTLLDLAHRPGLGEATHDVPAAIRFLWQRSDPHTLDEIAASQRLKAALTRAEQMASQGSVHAAP
ncbi:type IV toxin-antitoxin system AbiEi family antitoxin [Hoyosella sp. YIM 151337]|uniref:type IV toxin-antitoxin system AbiEi family antitoxin domain-containing protein n=1 Tax=Hoyosella sp. YIM 151337 TaxID=2992742 RepID=UPI002235874D|nr:type IV toxin-antitoxin system AbiEi family antitoxin [Hoyosella sp. YIM 151337]MCW4354123.1 type IV toxin-antitoxin system AbiEi family antitoxin [Hoyosella sp. YIM 151337]